MKFPSSILITAIGSSNGRSVHKILSDQFPEIKLFVCDTSEEEMMAPLANVERFFRVPKAKNLRYKEVILDTCKKYEIDHLIPIHDDEVVAISKFADELLDIGTSTTLSSMEALKIIRNKLSLYEFAKSAGINVIPTSLRAEFPYPMFFKPREGNGSVHCYPIQDEFEADFYLSKVSDGIFQPFISGIKVVVDFVSDGNGNIMCLLAREEIKTIAGNGTMVRIIENTIIQQEVQKIVKALTYKGLGNCEYFITSDQIYLIEINPRASSGVIFTHLAGLNIMAEYLNIDSESKIDIERKAIKYNQIYHRVYSEIEGM